MKNILIVAFISSFLLFVYSCKTVKQDKKQIVVAYDKNMDSIGYVNNEPTYFYIKKASYNQTKNEYEEKLKEWNKKYSGDVIAGIDEVPIPPEKYIEFINKEEDAKRTISNRINITRKQLTELSQEDFVNYDTFIFYEGKFYKVYIIPVYYQ